MTTFDDAKQLLADFPRKGAHFNWRENPGPTAALVRLVMQAPKPHEFARRLGAPVLYSSFACGLTADGTAEWPELRTELERRGVELRERDARPKRAASEAEAPEPAEAEAAPEPPAEVALRSLAAAILGGTAVVARLSGGAGPVELAAEAARAVRNLEALAGVPEGSPAEVARRLHPPRPTREIRAEAADLVVTDATILAYGSPAHRAALGDLLRGFRIGGAAPSTAEAAAG